MVDEFLGSFLLLVVIGSRFWNIRSFSSNVGVANIIPESDPRARRNRGDSAELSGSA